MRRSHLGRALVIKMRMRDHLQEMPVAELVLRNKDETPLDAMDGKIHVRADERLYVLFFAFFIEFERAVKIVSIGKRHCRHAVKARLLHQRLYLGQAVEKAVMAVGGEVRERSGHSYAVYD